MAASSGFTAPPMTSPGAGITIPPASPPGTKPTDEPQDMTQVPEEQKPGLFEDLHKKTRGKSRNVGR